MTKLPNKNDSDLYFIYQAYYQAKKSLKEGGIPIGAVLVQDNKIIAEGHNQRVQKNNHILHGEIDCLTNLGRFKSFKNTTLYSTLMPCYMCGGTIVQFKIPRIVVGEDSTFKGSKEFMESHGVKVVNLNLPLFKKMMKDFIAKNSALWNEDIGE